MPLPPVLIIEDNADSLEAMTLLLAKDFACTGVPSRDVAVDLILNGYVPACIVSDYSMPGMSIESFLNTLGTRKIKIVLVSAHSHAVAVGKKFGIKRILMKPTDPDELVRTIQQAIGSGEHSAV